MFMKNKFIIHWDKYTKPWKNVSREDRVAEVISFIDEVENQIDNIMMENDLEVSCGSAEDCISAYKALAKRYTPRPKTPA